MVSTPARARRKPNTIPAGPPPTIQQRALIGSTRRASWSILVLPPLERCSGCFFRRVQSVTGAAQNTSRRDDLVLEAAGGNDQKGSADGEQREGIGPQAPDAGAPEDDAARDVDEIRGRNEVAERAKNGRHGFARKNVAREKDARENGQKRELHGLGLRGGLAGDQDSQRECREQIGQREKAEQQNAAVDGHEEYEAHKEKNEAELEEADAQIGKQFPEKQAKRAHRRNEKLLESSTLLLADDREGREKGGDVEKHDGREAGKKEIRRTGVGIEQ